jgi:iron(III) transport system substrate-binding protein
VAYYGTFAVTDLQKLINVFNKRYPYIAVKHVRGGSGTTVNRIISEYRAGKREADVIALRAASAFPLLERGIVDPYFSSESNMIQSGLNHPKGLWVSYAQYLYVVGYNSRLVSPVNLPRSYGDLVDKKWANSISLDQEDHVWLQGLADAWGEAKAVDFLKSLMQLKAKVQSGRSLRAQLLGAGEYSIALNMYDFRMNLMKAQGAPVDFVLLDPILIEPSVSMLARHSPHPHASALLIDWFLSEEGQAIFESSEIGRHAARKGVGRALSQLIGKRNVKILTPELLGPKSDQSIKLFKEITSQ